MELQKYRCEIQNLKRTQRYWNIYLVNALSWTTGYGRRNAPTIRQRGSWPKCNRRILLFSKLTKFWWKRKRTSRSCVARKILGECLQNTGTAIRPANGRHMEIIPRTAKKEPADNIADLVLKCTPTKKRTRENGAKMRLVRTGALQPAECRYRQIISPGKPAAQCYGGNVSADPLCSEALLRTAGLAFSCLKSNPGWTAQQICLSIPPWHLVATGVSGCICSRWKRKIATCSDCGTKDSPNQAIFQCFAIEGLRKELQSPYRHWTATLRGSGAPHSTLGLSFASQTKAKWWGITSPAWYNGASRPNERPNHRNVAAPELAIMLLGRDTDTRLKREAVDLHVNKRSVTRR